MELKELIYKRKSVRSYTGEPEVEATIEKIKAYSANLKPLYPDIKVHSLGRDSNPCLR